MKSKAAVPKTEVSRQPRYDQFYARKGYKSRKLLKILQVIGGLLI
jgi:hypothetical protein